MGEDYNSDENDVEHVESNNPPTSILRPWREKDPIGKMTTAIDGD